MTNEYLFLTDEKRGNIEKCKFEDINMKILAIENTSLWIAVFSHPHRNEDSAQKLSEVHLTIMRYSPFVLSCESSEYYNKTLFPKVNELERKLRKLLYLAASISDNEKAKESVRQLEEKDFGEIFNLLFIDPNFISNMKKRINADNKSEFNGILGKGSINHNSRKFKAENIDAEHTSLNISYCNEPIKEVYHKLFDEALERYNGECPNSAEYAIMKT